MFKNPFVEFDLAMRTFSKHSALFQPILDPQDNYAGPRPCSAHPGAGGDGHESVEVLAAAYG